MEWVILTSALIVSVLLALTKSLRYVPNGLSEFELERQIRAEDKMAKVEKKRRALLLSFVALQRFKELLLGVGLAWLLFATHEAWVAALATLGFLVFASIVSARGWLDGVARQIQAKIEPHMSKFAPKMFFICGWLAPTHIATGGGGIASRDELRQLIVTDTQLLAPADKARLLGAFDFGSLLVADAMVPRDKIVTVDVKETIGPVLLDRLHKQKHNIYVVVKNDLDAIKGLLYMHDLTPLDPDLKEVADAIRPTVHYVPVDASLQDVLAASLKTGRQLFIAVDNKGKTKGLVTLTDALTHLNGEPFPKDAPVATKPDFNL